AQQAARLHDTDGNLGEATSALKRSAADPPGPDSADLDPRHRGGKRIGAPVASEVHPTASRDELFGQRLRRKQVAASAAGGNHKGRALGGAHNSAPLRRRRVSPSIIPIPSPSASIDEPP